MKPWLAPTLCSLGSFGFWGLFTKLSADSIDNKSAFIYQASGVLFAAVFSFFFVSGKVQLSGIGVLYSVLIGITYSLGCVFYFYAASQGNISTVVTVTGLYPLVTIFLSVIFLKEQLTGHQLLGIVFALMAMLLFAKP